VVNKRLVRQSPEQKIVGAEVVSVAERFAIPWIFLKGLKLREYGFGKNVMSVDVALWSPLRFSCPSGSCGRLIMCSRAEGAFLGQRAQPFTTADPRSKPISIFCLPA
jgi:hypothetical protein